MIQMPTALHTAWSPLWAFEHVPERPWWTYDGYYGTNPKTKQFHAGVYYKRRDNRSLWVSGEETLIEALAAYDAEHPMPAPRPLPGQVWAWIKDWRADGVAGSLDAGQLYVRAGTVSMVSGISPAMDAAGTLLTQFANFPGSVGRTWPMTGAVLVAGPSCYGRDCPWSPVETP